MGEERQLRPSSYIFTWGRSSGVEHRLKKMLDTGFNLRLIIAKNVPGSFWIFLVLFQTVIAMLKRGVDRIVNLLTYIHDDKFDNPQRWWLPRRNQRMAIKS